MAAVTKYLQILNTSKNEVLELNLSTSRSTLYPLNFSKIPARTIDLLTGAST